MMVIRVQGWLLMVESLFLLLPAAVSTYYGEQNVAFAFLATFLITAACGCLMAFAFHNRFRDTSMHKREGILLTSVVWVVFSIFGMLPLLFTSTVSSITDAFFESMSGFTTTGASVISDVEALPRGILFWRSLSQWIGGMGIILFTLAVLPMLNYKGGVTLFSSEVTGITHERIRPRVNQTAKSLWMIYFVMSVIMFVLLLFGPMNWFDALCHTLSTVSTGGFSTMNDGLHYWHNYYTDAVIIFFMLLCGVNFSIIYAVFVEHKIKPLKSNVTLKWYLGVILFGIVAIFCRVEYMDFCDNISDSILYSVFDTISAITSTGFSTIDYEEHGQFVFFLLLILMFFGGMAGSTSGGAKIDRFVVMVKNLKNEMYKTINPNAVRSVRLESKSVPRSVVDKVLAFLAIYVLIIVAGALFLTLLGIPAFDALFNSLSAISNIGFGYGELTGGIDKFANLPDVAKWMLAFEMLIGRLELFTILVIFTRNFWIKD
ncbi:MAG: TrkH family potassium uptake protein [Muribaculaceae bacterium]|nr:TrkH family potassium uptake protein [Muribaculaceae bacterium]